MFLLLKNSVVGEESCLVLDRLGWSWAEAGASEDRARANYARAGARASEDRAGASRASEGRGSETKI